MWIASFPQQGILIIVSDTEEDRGVNRRGARSRLAKVAFVLGMEEDGGVSRRAVQKALEANHIIASHTEEL